MFGVRYPKQRHRVEDLGKPEVGDFDEWGTIRGQENVLRLQVSMYDAALAKVSQGDKGLVCISSSRTEVDADIIAELLQHLSQVQAEVLEC